MKSQPQQPSYTIK